MRFFIYLLIVVAGLLISLPRECYSAFATMFQSQLVEGADAVVIADVHKKERSIVSGSVLFEGREDSVDVVVYESHVVEKLYGEVPSEPLIIQYHDNCSPAFLEEGRYLLFLKREGHLFMPLEAGFKVSDEKVFWFKKPFLPGDYGPEMGEVPLKAAIREVKDLIAKFKTGRKDDGRAKPPREGKE